MPPAPWAAPRQLRRTQEGKESDGNPSLESRATAAAGRRSRSCTRRFGRTSRPSSRRWSRMGAGCPASSWPSSSDPCAAAFSPTASLASAPSRAATSCSLRSPATVGSVRPARRDGCRALPRPAAATRAPDGSSRHRAGAVTFVQRFGSALNLNVHFYCVVPDGVWVREEGVVRFVPLTEQVGRENGVLQRRVGAEAAQDSEIA